jgi:hypothetical protein
LQLFCNFAEFFCKLHTVSLFPPCFCNFHDSPLCAHAFVGGPSRLLNRVAGILFNELLANFSQCIEGIGTETF